MFVQGKFLNLVNSLKLYFVTWPWCSSEQSVAQETPGHLLQTLEARCEEFEAICDQIYYILVGLSSLYGLCPFELCH
jgi:hypothetical protein